VESTLTVALAQAAQARDAVITAKNFDELVRQNQRRVYRVIFLLMKDSDAAEGLTQECFLRAYRKRSSFRGECAVETWLLRIAVNLARDHHKNRRASFWRKLVGLEAEEAGGAAKNFPGPLPSPERILLAREELNAVWATTAALSPQQRIIFLLRFAEEMTLAEIAQILQLKTGTVKAQLFRATSRVRELLRSGHAVD